MLRKPFRALALALLALVAIVGGLLIANGAPTVPPIAATDVASKPYVVKLHARWCPVCMITKQEWSDIEQQYAGRVNLLVVDNTTDSSFERSRAAAERFGLGEIIDGYHGATGMVLVIDGRSKRVLSTLPGKLPLDAYGAAIDSALRASAEG